MLNVFFIRHSVKILPFIFSPSVRLKTNKQKYQIFISSLTQNLIMKALLLPKDSIGTDLDVNFLKQTHFLYRMKFTGAMDIFVLLFQNLSSFLWAEYLLLNNHLLWAGPR